MRVLIKPLMTEKLALVAERMAQKQYAFMVALDVEKADIRTAIEEQYGVQVHTVRTAVMPARRRFRYTRKGVIEGSTPRWKKAYVTLLPGQEIDFYKNN